MFFIKIERVTLTLSGRRFEKSKMQGTYGLDCIVRDKIDRVGLRK